MARWGSAIPPSSYPPPPPRSTSPRPMPTVRRALPTRRLGERRRGLVWRAAARQWWRSVACPTRRPRRWRTLAAACAAAVSVTGGWLADGGVHLPSTPSPCLGAPKTATTPTAGRRWAQARRWRRGCWRRSRRRWQREGVAGRVLAIPPRRPPRSLPRHPPAITPTSGQQCLSARPTSCPIVLKPWRRLWISHHRAYSHPASCAVVVAVWTLPVVPTPPPPPFPPSVPVCPFPPVPLLPAVTLSVTGAAVVAAGVTGPKVTGADVAGTDVGGTTLWPEHQHPPTPLPTATPRVRARRSQVPSFRRIVLF